MEIFFFTNFKRLKKQGFLFFITFKNQSYEIPYIILYTKSLKKLQPDWFPLIHGRKSIENEVCLHKSLEISYIFEHQSLKKFQSNWFPPHSWAESDWKWGISSKILWDIPYIWTRKHWKQLLSNFFLPHSWAGSDWKFRTNVKSYQSPRTLT